MIAGGGAIMGKGNAVDLNSVCRGSLRRAKFAAYQRYAGGFPGTVRAQECKALVILDEKRDIVDSSVGAKRLSQMEDAEGRIGRLLNVLRLTYDFWVLVGCYVFNVLGLFA